MEEKKQPMKNLYLIGFMGVGKSHLGRMVSEILNFQFLDTDHVIESNQQRSISEIFDQEGEDYFRKLERELIESGLPNQGCVVACGGGLSIQEGMLELLKSKGVVVALFASKETILERTSRNNKRPLLNVENPDERIDQMMNERMPKYLGADASIATDGRMATEVVQHIVRTYRGINQVK